MYTRRAQQLLPMWSKPDKTTGKKTPSPEVVVVKGVFHSHRSPPSSSVDPPTDDRRSQRLLPNLNLLKGVINNNPSPENNRLTNTSKKVTVRKEPRPSRPLQTEANYRLTSLVSDKPRCERHQKHSPRKPCKAIAFIRDKDFSDMLMRSPRVFRQDFF